MTSKSNLQVMNSFQKRILAKAEATQRASKIACMMRDNTRNCNKRLVFKLQTKYFSYNSSHYFFTLELGSK